MSRSWEGTTVEFEALERLLPSFRGPYVSAGFRVLEAEANGHERFRSGDPRRGMHKHIAVVPTNLIGLAIQSLAPGKAFPELAQRAKR